MNIVDNLLNIKGNTKIFLKGLLDSKYYKLLRWRPYSNRLSTKLHQYSYPGNTQFKRLSLKQTIQN